MDTIATGLEVPWGVAFLPNGDAVVTERDSAKVLTISGADRTVTEVGTIGDAAPQGEGGLLGVAVSPAFDQDQTLYFYVSSDNDNRIVTAQLADGELGATTPIFTGIPLGAIHDGGRLAFGPDGMLYASTGETGDSEIAQDRDNLGGKILRLTPAGKPAPGNPFDTAIWSFGHRNVQGLAFVDEQLWASEFGQNTFDELNRIDAGANYGWPKYEGTVAPARATPTRRPPGAPTSPPPPAWRTPGTRCGWARCAAAGSGRSRSRTSRPASPRPSSSATTAGCGPSSWPPTATCG